MSFKDISYLNPWRPFCLTRQNLSFNFGRGHHIEQFCEIILNLDRWFRCPLKTFLIYSSGSTFILPSGTIWNGFEFGTVVKEMSFKDSSYLESWLSLRRWVGLQTL